MRAIRAQRVCVFEPAQSDLMVRAGPRLAEAARLVRIADVKRGKDLVEEVDELWLIHPEREGGMEEWVVRAAGDPSAEVAGEHRLPWRRHPWRSST